MFERLDIGRPVRVIGWDGKPITLDDLPTDYAVRWSTKRKAQIVAAVRGGLISFEEAVRRYRLSRGEFVDWEHFFLGRATLRGRANAASERCAPPPVDAVAARMAQRG
jgi:hypothetical protein